MKRILQVLGSLQRGGAETMIMNIYRSLDKSKYQFDFIVREPVENGYEEEIKQMGGRIFYVPSPKKIGIFKCIKLHEKVMKENGPYIAVHSHMNAMSFISMIAAKKANIKVRISHSHSTKFPGKIKAKLGKKLILKYSTDLLACSEEAGIALFGNAKFITVPNGIDLSKFLLKNTEEKREIQRRLNIRGENINICHVGRFVEVKNHNFILELARKLKEKNITFEIFLLGNGDLLDEMKEKAKTFNLNEVHFLGSVPNVEEYLKATDILILPSLYEGFPVTLVEAQAAGLPSLVSSNVTRDVDFGLNLIEFLQLETTKWEEYITSKKYSTLFDENKIYQAITKNNFNVNNSAKEIIKIYTKE